MWVRDRLDGLWSDEDGMFYDRLVSLELVAQTGNHAYHVDVAAATRAGVLVGMASSDLEAMGAVARSTIELAFGLMLAVMRRIPQTDQAMRRGEWPSFAGRTLAGKKLGIVGYCFGGTVAWWGATRSRSCTASAGARTPSAHWWTARVSRTDPR